MERMLRPYTKPSRSFSAFGFLNKVTATVTDKLAIKVHIDRYTFSAMSLAFWGNATNRSADGSIFTHSQSTTAVTMPANSPQKPAAGVVRFHNIPRITVPNMGTTKKPKSLCAYTMMLDKFITRYAVPMLTTTPSKAHHERLRHNEDAGSQVRSAFCKCNKTGA
jgi:hypothetical protein